MPTATTSTIIAPKSGRRVCSSWSPDWFPAAIWMTFRWFLSTTRPGLGHACEAPVPSIPPSFQGSLPASSPPRSSHIGFLLYFEVLLHTSLPPRATVGP